MGNKLFDGVAWLLLLVLTFAAAQETTGESGETTTTWGYSQNGLDWTGTCASGLQQSPIDIDDSETGSPSDEELLKLSLIYSYVPKARIQISETGIGEYSITNNGQGFGYMNAPIVGTTDHFDWESTKAVIHAPSEHTINGESYPLEMQIMHEINDLTMKREQAVYSILFEESEDEASALLESLIVGSDFRIDSLTGSDQTDYYAYLGSTTQPSCEEVVNWFLSAKIHTATASQIKYFTDKWAGNVEFAGGRGNNRMVKPVGTRQIYVVGDGVDDWAAWLALTVWAAVLGFM